MLTVLDTGSVPNLVRADLLPQAALASCDSSRNIVNLSSASNHRLNTIRVVTLTVMVDSYTARQPFVVVRKLGADALSSYRHVKSVRPRMKFIELEDGTRVTIRQRPQMVPGDRSTAETYRVPGGSAACFSNG